MSRFILDKKFSELYEAYFSGMLHFNYQKDKTTDDHGVDIWSNNGRILIDVKCYRIPYVRNFKPDYEFSGFFIETFLPKSKKDGWFLDKTKWTTHYILVKDCESKQVKYDKAWTISKKALMNAYEEAMRDDNIEWKQIDSAYGFILPYYYVMKWGKEL